MQADDRQRRSGGADHRALLVEDDPMMLQLLADVAQRAGLEPVACRSLSAARDALAGSGPAPAVAVVDDDLPDGTGTELVQQLRASPRLRNVPVVFCTSAAPPRRREIGRLAPVIHKPFVLGDVERVLREAAPR